MQLQSNAIWTLFSYATTVTKVPYLWSDYNTVHTIKRFISPISSLGHFLVIPVTVILLFLPQE